MSIIITPQADIDAYFEADEVNQSSLKDLQGGLGSFMAAIAKKKKDKEENKPTPEYFLTGGGVDCILTGEHGEFEKQYYVSSLEKKPSEVEIQIIDSVFHELAGADMLDKVEYKDSYDSILAAANEVGWQNNWKADTRVTKLIAAGEAYFQDLKESFGLKILSSEQNDKIQRIAASLRSHPRTRKYFDRVLQAEQKHIDFYYQLPIYFTYNGIACKALMDLVVVHKTPEGKIIKIEPIDLKTMSGATLQFNGKMKQHRYDIQAAWYTLALSEYFNFPMVDIDPFKFVVESTTSIGSPLVFEITPETLQHGRLGSPASIYRSQSTGRELYYHAVKGYNQLINEYVHYQEQGFREDILIELNPGVLTLDWLTGIQ